MLFCGLPLPMLLQPNTNISKTLLFGNATFLPFGRALKLVTTNIHLTNYGVLFCFSTAQLKVISKNNKECEKVLPKKAKLLSIFMFGSHSHSPRGRQPVPTELTSKVEHHSPCTWIIIYNLKPKTRNAITNVTISN